VVCALWSVEHRWLVSAARRKHHSEALHDSSLSLNVAKSEQVKAKWWSGCVAYHTGELNEYIFLMWKLEGER
jgi:hypothetical protein